LEKPVVTVANFHSSSWIVPSMTGLDLALLTVSTGRSSCALQHQAVEIRMHKSTLCIIRGVLGMLGVKKSLQSCFALFMGSNGGGCVFSGGTKINWSILDRRRPDVNKKMSRDIFLFCSGLWISEPLGDALRGGGRSRPSEAGVFFTINAETLRCDRLHGGDLRLGAGVEMR
jgi:hypothetical protein